ncbi:ovostatin-like [Mantella aurantiaca]
MWSGGHLLSLILLCLIAIERSQSTDIAIDPVPPVTCRSPDKSTEDPGPKCDYVMMAPFKLTVGSQGVVCTWLKCEVPVTVTVTMDYFFQSVEIFHKEETSEYFECTYFTVPEVEKEEAIFFTFLAEGDKVNLQDRKPAVIDVPRSACLVQKEKPLSRKGDTIRFRVVCFDENMKQDVKNFTKITFLDPSGTRVSQILNPPSEHGVVTASFMTSQFSKTGYWRIEVQDDKGFRHDSYVQLDDYELPRFNWNVECPSTISVLDSTATISGSAQYVYGEAVPGEVVVKCCRRPPRYGRIGNCFQGVKDICVDFTIELDENGKFDESLDMDAFKLPFSGLENYVSCEITMKEKGTDVLVPGYCSMWITNRLAILQLDRTTIGNHYNKVDIQFAATLTDEKYNPLAYRSITVRIDGEDVKYVTTDANGRAECAIETSPYHKANITLSAIYEDPGLCYGQDDYYMPTPRSSPYDDTVLYRYYSLSGSQLRIRSRSGELSCHQTYNMQVDYAFTGAGVGEDATTASIKYIILSRNNIRGHGEIPVDLTESKHCISRCVGWGGVSNKGHGWDWVCRVLKNKVNTFDIAVSYALCNISIVQEGTACMRVATLLLIQEPCSIVAAPSQEALLGKKGSVFFDFQPDHRFATEARILVMVFLAKDIISDTLTLNVGVCFENEVNMEFTEANVKPGATVHRKITAEPGSFCGSRVKDVSFNLINSYDEFNANNIISSVRSYIYGLQYGNVNYKDPEPPCTDGNIELLCNGMYVKPTSSRTDREANQDFQEHSVLLFSNLGTRRPKVCGMENEDFYPIYYAYSGTIFANVIGPEGVSIINSQIPDTITGWESDAFCFSDDKGIGLTIKPATITTIQPFFVEGTMPSYVTRGEVVVVSIVVANYLAKCAHIKAEVKSSDDYDVVPLDDMGEQCACSQERVSWTAEVTFKKIGKIDIRIFAETTKLSSKCDGTDGTDGTEEGNQQLYSDTIIRVITVEAEGIRREASSSHLAIKTEDSTVEVEIGVDVPDELVPDSFNLYACVMGDPVALSLENLDDLLSTPSGGCDQHQTQLMSTMFLEKYVRTFQALSDEQSKQFTTKLTLGYMNLLGYREYDGGYSQYGNFNDADPWVTAASLRTIHYLSKYMFIDEDVPNQDLVYISRLQDLETGCLNPKTGWQIYQGTYDPTIQFTAYAAITLHEMSSTHSSAGPMLAGVNKCLNNVDFGSHNTLTQCYILNAMASSDQWDNWLSYYYTLEEKATYDGDILYWDYDNLVTPVRYQYFPTLWSGDVLSTSLVLISMTKYPDPDQDLINRMASMAKWLSGKMTQQGGYYYSQATAAAIEALTLFGKKIHSGETNAHVYLYRDGNEVFNVTVDKSNKFVVQCEALSPTFGDYKFIVEGFGNVFVQLKAFYNTKIATAADSAYTLTAEATAPECLNGVARKINVRVSFSYNGVVEEGGITAFIIQRLTGYELDYSSTTQTSGIFNLSVDGNKVQIYMYAVKNTTNVFTVSMFARSRVSRYQTASVIAEEIVTGETGAALYSYPC